jgi:pyruvate/2-oxoacid:ferredoxin oxidoreductase beta subunit
MSAAAYLASTATLPYCKGCGHGLVLRALGAALEKLALAPEQIAIVTDIGCVGLADSLFAAPHTVHTTHGRSPAFAAGMALADSVLGTRRLKPIVMMGDGGAMIGLVHLVNAALLNPDVTVLLHNNFLFGMTGGQNSAFSPLDFVTATTRDGNATPPLDLARVLLASRAPFVARKLAQDRDLADVIASAIAHPGFALVEALELCTAYGTRWNALTGAQLHQVAEAAGYELGVLRDEPRETFGESYLRRHSPSLSPLSQLSPSSIREHPRESAASFSSLDSPVGIVLAGSAGEGVQSAASLLGHAAIRAGLHVTQKNDNPVTQGTGFSVSELILSAREILYTGIEAPDVALVVSDEGARELARSGILERVTEDTLVLADSTVALPELPCTVQRFSFRAAGAKLASLAAIVQWLDMTAALPMDALWSALDAKWGEQSAKMKESLRDFFQPV